MIRGCGRHSKDRVDVKYKQCSDGRTRRSVEEDPGSKGRRLASHGSCPWVSREAQPNGTMHHTNRSWNRTFGAMITQGLWITFLLAFVCEVLQTPSNLYTWRLTEAPGCTLGGKPTKLKHRRNWTGRMDCKRRGIKRPPTAKSKALNLLPPSCLRGRLARRKRALRWTIDTAKNLAIRVDMKRQHKFPIDITITSLQPDIVHCLQASEQVALMELTVTRREGLIGGRWAQAR